MTKVAIVDYGLCNLDSVARAVEECGGRPTVTDDPHELAEASHIILPGVGAFPDAMRNLRERRLDEAMAEHVLDREVPFLGICLGMQLIAARGWEVEETPGLGWLDGEVRRIEPQGEDSRLPHVGWNEVHLVDDSDLFKGIGSDRNFYFVHSYQLCPAHTGDLVATAPYAAGVTAAVQRGTIFGVQFHPEKSQKVGIKLLANFLRI